MADSHTPDTAQTFEPEGRAIPFAEEGAGPVVVLIAERGEGIGYLGALAHSLSQEDFRVVRIGGRADEDSASGPEERAQDVVDLLDHIGVGDAWIGGHGHGGTIARYVALEHHDRVDGVLLLGVEPLQPPLAAGLPVLVIQGTADDVTPAQYGQTLQESAPELVSVVAVEGAGHDFPASHVGETSWAIEDYLDWD
ncbi:alpha/beta hydrolase [Cnuibacter sp. UC19_7]|uniref:alpha/beta hydrolase n=1 Tax=Cnuibacter sp. UC19_7 TaxID=3350166 RepID=UPI0036715496